MRSSYGRVALPMILAVLLCGAADDPPPRKPAGDPIGERLARARADYRAKSEVLAKLVLDELARAEAAARKARDFAGVERIKAEREIFRSDGTLPTVVPAREYRRRIAKPREMLLRALSQASVDDLRAGKDADASRLRKEIAHQRAIWETVSRIGRPFIWGPPDIWSHDGDELILTRPTEVPTGVSFGNADLSDYNVHFEVRPLGGPGWFAGLFHAGDGRWCAFDVGINDRKGVMVNAVHDGHLARLAEMRDPPQIHFNTWYTVEIVVRGSEFRCFLNGVECFQGADARFTRGRVGFCTSRLSARLRRIEVTAPDGTILFRGLPRPPG